MEALVVMGLLLLAAAGVPLLARWSQSPTQPAPLVAAAAARAEALLVAQLTPAQYAQLRREGALDLPSPSIPGRVYRIPRERDLVRVYEGGRLTWWLCVGPVAPVPDADVVLTHTLMIAGDEAGYLRTANHFPATRGHPARVTTRPRRGEHRV